MCWKSIKKNNRIGNSLVTIVNRVLYLYSLESIFYPREYSLSMNRQLPDVMCYRYNLDKALEPILTAQRRTALLTHNPPD